MAGHYSGLFLKLNVFLDGLPANGQQVTNSGGPTLEFDLCPMLVIDIARQQ
jgi:hypothetical protein